MTTVRFLNGDLITYPSSNPEELIEAICKTYPTPIHRLQVTLCRDEDIKDHKDHNNIVNALIFPKKRVVLREFQHIFRNDKNKNIVNWEEDLYGMNDIKVFDFGRMTNESIIQHILSLPNKEIPNQIFSNPSDVVVDFIANNLINNKDIKDINDWFISNIDSERGRYIFSNPSDRIVDLMADINVDSLFEKYIENIENNEYEYTLSAMADCILAHPQVTEEMIVKVTDVMIPGLNLSLFHNDHNEKEEKNMLRFLCEFRHIKNIHPEFLITLTELLIALQYCDCEIVF